MHKITTFLIPILCFTLLSSSAQAQLISIDNLNLEETENRSLGMLMVSQMNHPMVIAKMKQLGVDPNEEKQRILALTDREIRDIIENPNQTGGDVIVISLTTILLIFLIYLLVK